MTVIRKIARPLLASSFVYSGVNRLRHADESTQYITPALDAAAKADPRLRPLKGREKLVTQVLSGAQIGAGALFALGRLPRLTSTVLVATGSVNAYLDFRASAAQRGSAKDALLDNSLQNIALVGAVAITAVDTDGSPSLAWRANRLGHDIKKKSDHLSSEVKKKSEDLLDH